MARKTSLMSLRQMTEINLTPMMDLSFMLVITFLITFPLVEQGIPVRLPKGKSQEITSKNVRNVTVDERGAIYLDNAKVSILRLREEIGKLRGADADLTVLVRADERVRYGDVVQVMKVLYDEKVTKLALVTHGEGWGTR